MGQLYAVIETLVEHGARADIIGVYRSEERANQVAEEMQKYHELASKETYLDDVYYLVELIPEPEEPSVFKDQNIETFKKPSNEELKNFIDEMLVQARAILNKPIL